MASVCFVDYGNSEMVDYKEWAKFEIKWVKFVLKKNFLSY
jgi:hypothetical protein